MYCVYLFLLRSLVVLSTPAVLTDSD